MKKTMIKFAAVATLAAVTVPVFADGFSKDGATYSYKNDQGVLVTIPVDKTGSVKLQNGDVVTNPGKKIPADTTLKSDDVKLGQFDVERKNHEQKMKDMGGINLSKPEEKTVGSSKVALNSNGSTTKLKDGEVSKKTEVEKEVSKAEKTADEVTIPKDHPLHSDSQQIAGTAEKTVDEATIPEGHPLHSDSVAKEAKKEASKATEMKKEEAKKAEKAGKKAVAEKAASEKTLPKTSAVK